jgi:hypothetical protein
MTETSPETRLFLIGQAFGSARRRRATDLRDAKTQAQANAILANVDKLEAQFLQAATIALDATSAAVEEAYDAASAAQAKIDKAYENAVSITEKIGLVGDIVGKVGTLIKAASGKKTQ